MSEPVHIRALYERAGKEATSGPGWDGILTDDPEKVTCDICRGWMRHRDASAGSVADPLKSDGDR